MNQCHESLTFRERFDDFSTVVTADGSRTVPVRDRILSELPGDGGICIEKQGMMERSGFLDGAGEAGVGGGEIGAESLCEF